MQTQHRIAASTGHWIVPAFLAICALAGCASSPVVVPLAPAAPPPSTVSQQPDPAADEHSKAFARWVADFTVVARNAGIDEATLKIAFDGVRFIPRVIELDNAQPEFNRAVWDYLDGALSAQRIAHGQDMLLQWRTTLDPIAARYGVAAESLVAIWGVESSYGRFMGDFPTIDALATLGFEGRRAQWACGQLLAALNILHNGDIDRAHMLGSWAGAMGQTQFLPSTFLAHAVDADGDGRRDIWASVPDVIASTANYLAHSGWQAHQAWGLEVRLPAQFDYARADADVRLPTTEWAAQGVQAMDGSALPAFSDASIVLPAGARGPAFLVGPNFRTILRYNNSTSYALAVGLLAQRLAGGPAVQAAWPRDLQTLTRSQVLALQTALNARGFDCGTPDGMPGPATQRCVRGYQRSLGLPPDGYATADLLQRLQPPSEPAAQASSSG